ncbi:hypothetical protein [Chryseobacterium rhizosphaerae]|jgi:hypothetical protein|uniref:Uncharacterized protein n=1 Tax=Chryseobacterium rhizosphaerae TaxID=395937 RepID=A0ABX9IRA1_9FLAO|nr:hypothetical protein [Chryseobacterium rhizosphaerae]MDC8098476.1 hypothetical protein [Chryseobacterium rhizosphaerae]MDR6547159.1 hypothetical protein [Chryseobacterium rhizosphaerae]REC78915.1 hypothetical protein DRF57_01165 [Chryseobacterium rhizosphaerae]GEN69402.1 hypothetical protein CRH01_39700 [Chryseobacterium rhizosphaerae]
MKKNALLTAVIALSFSTKILAQVGINTATPESTLDIRGKNHLGAVTSKDGVLVPRVNDLVANGSVNGQLVYLIADSGAFTKGFYYWNNNAWTSFGGDSTNDAWINDPANTMVKLGTLSNGSTTRAAGTDFVAKDNGAVGIGTSAPDISAIVDITATNKGILIPRVALTSATDQVTIASPATGLMVFNTGTAALTFKGFVYWNGTEWRSLNNTSTINPTITGLNCSNAIAFPVTFTSGTPYTGTITVPYSGGNGGSYPSGSPFTQNGLTFTLNAGTLNNGNGSITYSVTGIPNFSSPSTITVPLSFLGFNCSASIGNNSSAFTVGEIKSARVVVNATAFLSAATPPTNMMNGKLVTNTTTNTRQGAFKLASSVDQAKFIEINGLRMDFMASALLSGNTSPKFFNTSSSPIAYNTSSLSTNDANTDGVNTVIAPGFYSYRIDGDDNFSTGTGRGEYVNVMVTFNNGEWYNCTWHATRDANNYYFYMTAQRLN